MHLTLEQIKSITEGAVEIWEEQGLVCFSRFSSAQRALYQGISERFYIRAHGTAGIKFRFRTDSETLSLKVQTEPGSGRKYFSIDIYVNGSPVGYLDNFQDPQWGKFSGAFALEEGLKLVTVYLPWSVNTKLEELCLDDGAILEPVHPKKKLLLYGDSITQGYDAQRPSMRYAAKLAAFLDAEEQNRAIGGERFCPYLAETVEPFRPDYIAVAYGTNDWSGLPEQEFKERCGQFLHTVSEKNPQAEFFVITPIWRADWEQETACGSFAGVGAHIRKVCRELPNVTVIRGFDLVPHDPSYYYDKRLHPNDEGFAHYTENLHRAIGEARRSI